MADAVSDLPTFWAALPRKLFKPCLVECDLRVFGTSCPSRHFQMSALHFPSCPTQSSLAPCLPLPHPRVRSVRGTVRISCGLLDTISNGIFSKTVGVQSIAAEARLLSAIKNTERGLKTPPSIRQDILQAVNELEEIGKGTVTTGTGLSATWRLLWTTEKVGDCIYTALIDSTQRA